MLILDVVADVAEKWLKGGATRGRLAQMSSMQRIIPMRQKKHWLKTILAPKVFLPIVIGVGLLVALIVAAGPQQALSLISHFQLEYLIAFFLLMAGYEVVRCAQWHYLLKALNITVPLRTQIFSYAIGEFAKNLPIGNFVPDYILTREEGTDFGRASSSSLLVSVLEVAVALAGIVIIGIDGWTWIRPVILIGTFVFVILAWAFYRWHHSPQHNAHQATSQSEQIGRPRHTRHAPQWARRVLGWKWVQGGLHELHELTQGEATLLHPQVVAISTLACAIYMALSGLALYVVIVGLGLTGINWEEALSASFFSLAVATIIPIPTDLGSSEASGAGALVAMGLATVAAVSTLLLYRFLNLVEQILVALLAIVVLPGEFRAMWRARPKAAAPQPPQPSQLSQPGPGSA